MAVASASLPTYKRTSPHAVPGWNAVVKEAHHAARDAFSVWLQMGRPRHGAVWDLMRKSRAKFKLLLRQCRRSEAQSRADALATHLRIQGVARVFGTNSTVVRNGRLNFNCSRLGKRSITNADH